ncbi:MAG: transcription antitermination factor NusB [Chthoniobacterales bacterium]
MGVRREGREAAAQFLYQRDLGGAPSVGDLTDFYAFRGLSPSARRFCQALIVGILEKFSTIDETLQASTKNYELGRLSAVDRNVLRIALYEMFFCPDVPPVVVINEAIDIAKKYGTEDSGRFVNGVLDQVKKKVASGE